MFYLDKNFRFSHNRDSVLIGHILIQIQIQIIGNPNETDFPTRQKKGIIIAKTVFFHHLLSYTILSDWIDLLDIDFKTITNL
jgi:hypothetical protein